MVTMTTSAAVCAASFFGRCSVCPIRGCDSCRAELQAASSGFAMGDGENVPVFVEVWASGWFLLPIVGPLSAPAIAASVPVPPVVPVVVFLAPSANSSAPLREQSWYRRSPGSRLVPVWSRSRLQGVPGLVGRLVPGLVGRLGLGRFPSGPSWSQTWLQGVPGPCFPPVWLPVLVVIVRAVASKFPPISSSLQTQDYSSSRSRPLSPARVQASSLTFAPSAVELCSP